MVLLNFSVHTFGPFCQCLLTKDDVARHVGVPAVKDADVAYRLAKVRNTLEDPCRPLRKHLLNFINEYPCLRLRQYMLDFIKEILISS